jgi:hypothetical protein
MFLLLVASAASAERAVSANDSKLLLVNGVPTVPPSRQPDSIAIIDLSQRPPRLLYQVEAHTSVVGPPLSVAITPDEGFGCQAAARRGVRWTDL